MQIVITVGEEEHPTTQVLGAVPIGEPMTYTSPAEEAVLDAGAGPTEGEEFEAELAITTSETQGASVDGGSASPVETGVPEEAGPAPTVSDFSPTEPGPPRLRPVD